MVTGWRRVFCTSIPNDRDKQQPQQQQQQCNKSPRFTSKFGFFSNPSTPRFQSQPVSRPTLRCRTTATAASTTTSTPTSSLPNSPKLQCKTESTNGKKTKSPRLFYSSNPSSPKSPSSFSLLKPSFRNRCGVCLQSVKTGQGMAIFTAECSHTFHFPCISSHVTSQQLLVCPVCSSHWQELPLLALHGKVHKTEPKQELRELVKTKNLRVYDDDEPLRSPSPGYLINPIPESNENDDGEENAEFQGFYVNPTQLASPKKISNHEIGRNIELSLLQESAVLATDKSSQTYVVVLKVKAPPCPEACGTRRPPTDLVTLLDVSGSTIGEKLQMMKRAMKLVISSLASTDRLSIIAFSANSKRLLPLRRMTADGRRSARRIVEAMSSTGQGGMSVNDALRKAAKVLEDRRERNSVASIMILSNGQEDRSHTKSVPYSRSSSLVVSSTRFGPLEIPVHAVCFGDGGEYGHPPPQDPLSKCISGLLNVVVQDLRLRLGFVSDSTPAKMAAVYSIAGRPASLKPGSVRLGDLYAEEDRELLIELKVPASSAGPHYFLSVRSSFVDPSSQEQICPKEQVLLVPRPQTARSSSPSIQRLRNLHLTTRAIAEARRLIEHNDLSGASHLLSSARALLMKSSDSSASFYVRGLEAELVELQRRRQQPPPQQQQRHRGSGQMEEKSEPLTPTSAWRAAERLAKVAIMRKHMNRVSDLHGFENARF
ncbi:hypothetical protein HS088_TW03G00036 [Tripterygium wilfordii]|uniref:Zinc finger family protein n=1 Tax=Tripterygium wilfordii TaxID=458696 RepID=A0A7J7DTT9_TRIWF|nr:probable E3 ubiquitin-protein ligase EDA40 [Tripterygium wilfordii]KAF5749711.1 hypothetical protein HS088_TW03G00036 [Tripterygium wilfordii]